MSTSHSKLRSCCSSTEADEDGVDGRRSIDRMHDDVLESRVFLPSNASPQSANIEEYPLEFLKKQSFDVNMYATKKSAANGLLDLALLMANTSQLKHILVQGPDIRFYHLMLTLIIASIVLQVFIGIALLYLVRIRVTEDETDKAGTERSRRADRINNWVVASIFLLTVINIFISAFGLDQVEKTERA